MYLSYTGKHQFEPTLENPLSLALSQVLLDFLLKPISNWSCLKFSILEGSWVMRNCVFFHQNELFSQESKKITSTKRELSDVGLVMRHKWDSSPRVLPCCLHPLNLLWELLAQLCSLSRLNYFTLFSSEHLLSHKELPDHVVIKILTTDLDLYIKSIAVRAFLSQALLCWIHGDFQISEDSLLKTFCFCHHVRLKGKKIWLFKILSGSD